MQKLQKSMAEEKKYASIYPDLSVGEFRQLCYMAYCGEIQPSDKAATLYRKRFKVDRKKYDETASCLVEKGYLQTKSFVRPEKHLKILDTLFRYCTTWADSFSSLLPERSRSAEYLCKIAHLLINQEFYLASKVTRPFVGLGYKQFNLFKYIQDEVLNDVRYMSLLNETEMVDMVDEFLRDKFAEDELDESVLAHLSNAIPLGHKYHDEIKDELAAYRFFLTGEYAGPAGKPTLWSKAIEAILLAYRGELNDSLKTFKEALRFCKGNKHVFPSCILNYVYGIVLHRIYNKNRSDEYIKNNLDAFRLTKEYRLEDENVGIRLILDDFDKDVNYALDDVSRRMGYVQKRHENNLFRSWAFMVNNFYGIQADAFTKPLHSAKILQYELSSYLPIGPLVKDRLAENFGGKPLLSTMRRRNSWEILLSDIEASVAQEKTTLGKRVAYYIKGKELLAVVEQNLKDDGVWHDGKLLSLSEMATTGYESMDSEDMAIASQMTKGKSFGSSDIDILVPHLYGTDRLRVGNYYQGVGTPVEIVKEEPYMEFTGKGSVIEITTNAARNQDGEVLVHTVKMDSPTSFRLITTNVIQRSVIKSMLQIGKLPATALMSAKKTIESLKGIIAIRESILDLASEPSILSKGILAVRVSPEGHEYHVNIAATALEDGIIRMVPAEGEEIVYDEVDGLTHCVNRNIVQEYDNFRHLHTFLEERSKAEVLDGYNYKIWSLEGLLLLLAFVYDNREKYFLEWPEGSPLKFRGDIKSSDIDIVVQSDMEWFTVEGDVVISGKKYSLSELVSMCCADGVEGFIKLSEDEYIRMSEKLKKHIALMNAFPMDGTKKRHVAKFQVGALAKTLEGLKTHMDGEYTRFMAKTKDAFDLHPELPQIVTAQLRDYQLEGFRWMCRLDAWGAGACLADDMGLGKTLQALAFLAYKAEEGASLVIAPKSVVLNWVTEAQKFTNGMNVIVLNNSTKRAADIKASGPHDIILCTYGLLATEAENLKKKKWNVVCLDEAHQIKNRQTISSHTVMGINAKSRIILTGTPLQNNLSELWNLFQFINPGLLGPWPYFRDSFMIPTLDNQHKTLLKDMTMPFILRRTKKEVLSELPEKLLNTHYVEMTESESKVYEEMRRQAEVKFKRHKTREEKKEAATLDLNFFTELMKLRQAACSMRLIHEQWKEPSSKIMALMEILDHIMEDRDNNVIVFSQFTSFLDMVKPELKRRDMDYLYLDGQTPLEKRQQIVNQFQEGKCRLFLSSLKAGGLGINLTAANYVILLDPWWNPAIENQAMDRAHRIGQKRVVSVIRLISSQTIEEKIMRLHETKQNLSDDILEGTAESYKLTYEDVMDMVAPF